MKQETVKTEGSTNMAFEPKIVGILCNWCSYAGADLAGISRKKFAPNVRVVRVMCSGRVEPTFILKALEKGADGVLILGCHPGDCHYSEGNYKTIRRIPLLKKMLAQMGVEEADVDSLVGHRFHIFVLGIDGYRPENNIHGLSDFKKLVANL